MAVEYLHTTPQGTRTLVIGLNSLALEPVLPNTTCISSRLNSHKKQEHILLLFSNMKSQPRCDQLERCFKVTLNSFLIT